MRRRVAVLARRAVSGRVKSRLSPALPPVLACALHAAMAADTLACVAAAEVDGRCVLWDGDATPDALAIAVPAGVREGRQAEGDLGVRLAAACAAGLEAPEDAVVLVGTDCPDLRPRHLAAAFMALADHDVVVGPSHDGGYWLIGLARPLPALFEDIPWGGPEVLARTLERAHHARLRVATLETLSDLDTPADLVRRVTDWLAAPAAERAPATAHALSTMGLLPPADD
jgi:rSAM/selenodomain-associated transferase 1